MPPIAGARLRVTLQLLLPSAFRIVQLPRKSATMAGSSASRSSGTCAKAAPEPSKTRRANAQDFRIMTSSIEGKIDLLMGFRQGAVEKATRLQFGNQGGDVENGVAFSPDGEERAQNLEGRSNAFAELRHREAPALHRPHRDHQFEPGNLPSGIDDAHQVMHGMERMAGGIL